MIMKMRSWVVVGMVLLGVLAVVGEVRAKHLGLNGKEDFAEIARRGFFETMHTTGSFDPVNPYNPPTVPDYIGRQRNSYTWSSAWFNGKYYVGTVRNVLCYLAPEDPPDPLCSPVDQPGLNDRAELWTYTPAGPGGTTGSWARVLQSPCIVAGGGFLLQACAGYPALGVTANLPRDIGYRGMMVSNVGDLPLDTSALPRLWVNTFGMGGRVLQSTTGNPGSFNVASLNGLATIPSITTITGLTALQNVATVDLGYRSILIWKGRVCIAPVGSLADVDLAVNPTVLCNSNPASTSSTWQTIVNVKTHPTLGDPNNLGIFQMGVFNGDLYIGVTNRTTGVQVWKLPESQCPVPASSSTICVANSSQWQRLITHGGGRPIPSDGMPDSAGVSAMQVFDNGSGNALYIGTSDSAAFQNSRTELFRINGNDTWDLIVGSPRQKSVMDALNADPALVADFNCLTTVNTDRTQFDFDGSGPNPAENACFPLGNMMAGFGTGFGGGTAPVTGGYCSGPFGYVWRMAVHNDGSTDPSTSGNFLYLGTLHTGGGNFGGGGGSCTPAPPSNPSGFDLLKSNNGVTWNTAANTVNNNGLGNSENYGVRTLVSVPNWPNAGPGGSGTGPALLVGTANPATEEVDEPDTGGAEVHLGTCAPGSTPTAVASVVTQSRATSPYKNQVIGPVQLDSAQRYVAFDDDSVHNSSVDVALVGSASYDTFCGDLISYEWRDITGGVPGALLGSGGPIGLTDPKLAIPNLAVSLPTGSDYTDYTFRLIVTDANALEDFEDVNVRASYNLPPTAAITPVPATITTCPSGGGNFGGGGGGGNSRVCLVDVNGNLSETFTAQGICTDPENPAFITGTASCVWSADSGVTFAGLSSSTGGSDGDPDALNPGTSYTVTAPVGDGNIFLMATDDHGYIVQARTRVRVIAPVHDVAVTAIEPEAGLATVLTPKNVTVTVKNNGHFPQTFNVTLTDAIGGTGGAAQSVTLDPCVATLSSNSHAQLSTCPFQALIFSWTPTAIAGQPHTLTATVTTVITGETNTADNSRSVSVALNNQPPVANPQSLTRNEDTSVPIITLTGSDPDNDPLTFQVVTGPSHGTLSGTLASRTYTPTLNYNDVAPDSFTFTVSDGSATSAPATVSITVNPVNDAPSFTKGGNQTVAAAAGAQTVVGWATFLSAGPSDESGQALNFIIASNTNSALFTVQPVIEANGTLTYTPLSTAPTGTATVGVRLHDTGGTSPGVDTSALQTFTITVNQSCLGLCMPLNVIATVTVVPRQVHVAWTERATNETRYERQRCRLIGTTSCTYSFLSPNLATNANDFNDTVPSGGTYRYRVRACNASSCSTFSVSNNIAVP